jgi:hypothetical protein
MKKIPSNWEFCMILNLLFIIPKLVVECLCVEMSCSSLPMSEVNVSHARSMDMKEVLAFLTNSYACGTTSTGQAWLRHDLSEVLLFAISSFPTTEYHFTPATAYFYSSLNAFFCVALLGKDLRMCLTVAAKFLCRGRYNPPALARADEVLHRLKLGVTVKFSSDGAFVPLPLSAPKG